FTLLDQLVDQLQAAGVQVGIRIEGWHPMWAGGQPCEGFGGQLHIPGHVNKDSGAMRIGIPGGCGYGFRGCE
ncbi:MAG: hypothetical protein DMG76_06280, partial [Acidobacteria bacterium]